MLIEVTSSSMADVTPTDNVEVPPKFAYKEPTEKWEEEDDPKKEKSLLVEHFKDFTNNTTLHGLKYVGEDGRNFVERSLWCLSVIGSCILCGVLVYPIYSKWQNTPTITSVEETNYAIWNIYFPAVTVCSNNKVVESQIESLLKLQPWKNISKEDKNFKTNFRAAIKATVLYDNEPEILDDMNDTVADVLDEHRKKFGGVLQKVMHTCSKMILACVWQGKMVPCTELFSVRRTDDGFCCSFNTLRMSEQFKDAEELNVGIEEDDEEEYEYYGYGGYGYGYYGGGEYGGEYGEFGGGGWNDPWDNFGGDEYGNEGVGDNLGGDIEDENGNNAGDGSDIGGADSGNHDGNSDENEGDGEQSNEDTNDNGGAISDNSGGNGDSDDSGGGNSDDSGEEDSDGGSGNNDDSGGGGNGHSNESEGNGNSDDSGEDADSNDSGGGGDSTDSNTSGGDSDDNGGNADVDGGSGDIESNDSGGEGDHANSNDSSGNGDSNDSGGDAGSNDIEGSGGNSDDNGGEAEGDAGDSENNGDSNDIEGSGGNSDDNGGEVEGDAGDSENNGNSDSERKKRDVELGRKKNINQKLNKIIGTKPRKLKTHKKGMRLSKKSKKSIKNKQKEKINKHKEMEKKLIRKKREGKYKLRRANGGGKKALPPTKLKRSNAANSRLGLSLLLYPDQENYGESVLNNYVGFKVLVHSPYDFAEVAAKGFVIDASVESFIAVSAQYTESTDVVKEMPLFKRDCLRHDEDMTNYPDVKLTVFSNYSRKACLLECQALELFKKCGCLPYYFPDFSSIWKQDTSCDYVGLLCLSEVSDQAKAIKPTSQLADSSDIAGFIPGPDCNCPSDCKETLYSQELSQAKLRPKNRFITRLEREGQFLYNLTEQINNQTKKNQEKKKEKLQNLYTNIVNSSSIVHIYFKELGIVKYSKDQLYGALDVIAAFGGMVGLCIGFSILSGLEIIYWFTFRLFLEIQKRKKNKKE